MNNAFRDYHNSPTFKTLVDIIYHQLLQGQYSASEVREAATMASIKYEQEFKLPKWKEEIGLGKCPKHKTDYLMDGGCPFCHAGMP